MLAHTLRFSPLYLEEDCWMDQCQSTKDSEKSNMSDV